MTHFKIGVYGMSRMTRDQEYEVYLDCASRYPKNVQNFAIPCSFGEKNFKTFVQILAANVCSSLVRLLKIR